MTRSFSSFDASIAASAPAPPPPMSGHLTLAPCRVSSVECMLRALDLSFYRSSGFAGSTVRMTPHLLYATVLQASCASQWSMVAILE